MENVEIIPVDQSNLEQLGFYCYRSKKKTVGYQSKLEWLEARLDEGMQVKLLHTEGRLSGFIEYSPAETAWRVIKAPDYLVIHCIYTMGRYQGEGYRSLLLTDCLKDAKEQGKAGIAVVLGESTFLPAREVFEKNRFELADICLEGFEIMHTALGSSTKPSFPTDWELRRKPFSTDLHVVYAPQCPYNAMYLDVVKNIGDQFRLKTTVRQLKTSDEIQEEAPTPVGVYALLHEGEVILHHPVTEKDLHKVLKERLSL